MTEKQLTLARFIWLMSLLVESQEVLDIMGESTYVKQNLKNRINGLKLEIDKFFSDDRFNKFYIEGGAEGLQSLINLHAKNRELYIKALNEDNAKDL